MALEKLTPPPVGQPFDLNGRPNPAWSQWFERLYRILGKATGSAELSVTGNAATADEAASVPTVELGLGGATPDGVQEADPGTILTDPDSGNIWQKTSGSGNTGWTQL